MFEGFKLRHEIVKVEADPEPPDRCELYATCHLKLQLDNDRPRKVMEIFELNKNEELSADKTGKIPLHVSNLRLLVQDSRPLFNWPEFNIPETKYDNWEPQFKPAEVTAAEEAAVAAAAQAILDARLAEDEAKKAAAAAAAKALAEKEEEEDEEDDEDEEDEEEVDEEAEKKRAAPGEEQGGNDDEGTEEGGEGNVDIDAGGNIGGDTPGVVSGGEDMTHENTTEDAAVTAASAAAAD